MLAGLSLKIRQVLALEAIETILASVSSPSTKRGNRDQGTLTVKGIQHLEEANPSPGRAIKVRCSIPGRTVLSVVVLTVKTSDRKLIPTSVAVRAGTWLRTAHRTGIRIEVMLSLVLIHRVQQQPS